MARIISLTTACALALAFSSTVFAQEYAVRLTRLAKVGEKYRLTATSSLSEKMKVSRGDAILQNRDESFSLELVAEISVLEVSKGGGATRKSIAIEKCLLTKGGETKPLLAPGTVLMAMLEGGKTVFKVNGTPVDPATEKAISLAIALDTGGPSEDAVFGTREKKKVGETWEINTESAIESLKNSIQVKNKADLKGIATLENVVKEGKETFLLVKATFTVNNFTLPAPTEFQTQNNLLQASISGKFPIDPASKLLENSQRTQLTYLVSDNLDLLSKTRSKIQGSTESQLKYRIEYLP
ncbi:MAG TPA: hypothetical protein VJ302_29170 [Blastocatellia bacterium]|nr:hypothetical protein [Blastocatellia bacterium]